MHQNRWVSSGQYVGIICMRGKKGREENKKCGNDGKIFIYM